MGGSSKKNKKPKKPADADADDGGALWRSPDLPTEVLESIFSRLPYLDDRIRFRAVSKRWRTVEWAPHAPPSSWPWALLSPNPNLLADGDASAALLEFTRFPLPDFSRGSRIVGSFGPHLLLSCRRINSYCIFNPFTGSKLPFPGGGGLNFVRKAVLSSSTVSDSGSPVAVAAIHSKFRLSVRTLKPRSTRWVHVWVPGSGPYFSDAVFFKGLLRAVTAYGALYSIDVAGLKVFPVLPPDTESGRIEPGPGSAACYYLLESRRKLVLVQRILALSTNTTTGFRVFEPPQTVNLPYYWKEVGSLGGHAFFLSASSNRSINSSDLEGVEEDCIYFTGDEYQKYTQEDVLDGDHKRSKRQYAIYNVGTFSLRHPDRGVSWRVARRDGVPETNWSAECFASLKVTRSS